jgi:LAO/AO transport system kinase
VTNFKTTQQANGRFESKRQQQALAWMWERIQAGLRHEFSEAPAVRAVLQETTGRVLQGQLAPSTAARELLATFFRGERK